MPKKLRLVCRLDLAQQRAVPSNLAALRVNLHEATRADAPVTSFEASCSLPGEDPPPAPVTWLQLWHVGQFERQNLKPEMDPFERELRKDDVLSNDLLAQLPGYIARLPTGAFQFRLLAHPVFQTTGSNPRGWFELVLHDAKGQPWKPGGRDARIRIRSAGADDDCDLACVLADAQVDPATATPPGDRPLVLSIVNLTHALGAMIEEGGLSAVMHLELPLPSTPQAQWSEAELADAELATQARWVVRRFGGVGLANGQLALCSTGFKSEKQIVQSLKTMRDQVKSDLFPMLPGLDDKKTRFKRLFLVSRPEPATNPYYPAQLTPCSKETMLQALAWSWKSILQQDPPPAALRLLCAHWGLETGFGKAMYCYNVGNVKAFDSWKGGVTFYQGGESSRQGFSTTWYNGAPLESVTFDYTPTRQGRFRAFATLQEGANDYLQVKRGYAHAWPALLRGDAAEYAHQLKTGSKYPYYEANEADYTRDLVSCNNQVSGLPIPTPSPTESRRLTPSGFDPTRDPNYRAELFHPYPPVGDRPPEACPFGGCYGTNCKGAYAWHMGYREGQSIVQPPIVHGRDHGVPLGYSGSLQVGINDFLRVSEYTDSPFAKDNQRFADFAAALKEHLTEDAVIILSAGLLGCHINDWVTPKGDFARHPKWPPESAGTNSFADLLRRKLGESLPDVSVWAHASRGEPVRNPELRAFTAMGSADVIFLHQGFPSGKVRVTTTDGIAVGKSGRALDELWREAFFPTDASRRDPTNLMPFVTVGISLQDPRGLFKQLPFGTRPPEPLPVTPRPPLSNP